MRTAITTKHKQITSNSFWERQSLRQKFVLFRLPELFVALAVGGIITGISAALHPNEMDIPVINISNSSDMNPLYAYPLTLRDTTCFPEELAACQVFSTSPCCKALYDENGFPTEAVDDTEGVLICVLVPLAFLLLRTLIWRSTAATKLFTNKSPALISSWFWALVFWDSVLGTVLSVGGATVLTYVLKRAIGMPRPIFYALDIFTQTHTSQRQSLRDARFLSFPSGHSSSTMSALGYVSVLVGIMDSSALLNRGADIFAKLAIVVSVGLFMMSVWVGGTRITGYWHSAVDVCAGWMLGGGCAAVVAWGFTGISGGVGRALIATCTTGDNEDEYDENKPQQNISDMEINRV